MGRETPSLLHLHTSYLSANCGVPLLMTPGARVYLFSALCPLLSPLGLRENRRRRKPGEKGRSAGGQAAALRLAFVQLGRAVLISSHRKPRMCAPIIRGYGVTPREQSIP